MHVEEQELVRRAQAGDRQAFDKLVVENKDKVFALIYRMTENRETALDLLQDSFLAAYKSLKKFRGDSGFSSWLYRIASNKTLNYIRRARIIPFYNIESGVGAEPAYEMTDKIENEALQKALTGALKSLPPQQKLAFNLRFYEELPFAEIAVIMDKSESTVKTHYQKATEKLREALKDFRD
jgi:RNA polymerase sigma-70 factor (ECF subfamily)